MSTVVNGKRGRGRPRTRLKDNIKRDKQELNLTAEDAENREQLRWWIGGTNRDQLGYGLRTRRRSIVDGRIRLSHIQILIRQESLDWHSLVTQAIAGNSTHPVLRILSSSIIVILPLCTIQYFLPPMILSSLFKLLYHHHCNHYHFNHYHCDHHHQHYQCYHSLNKSNIQYLILN